MFWSSLAIFLLSIITSKMKFIPQSCLLLFLFQAVHLQAAIVTNIAAGSDHSLFIKSDGSLWVMGFDVYGQLGDGTLGFAPYYGTNRPEQIAASNVVAIAAGGDHSLFIKSDGSLWAMGLNYFGQLGDGTYGDNTVYSGTNRPEQIVTDHVVAVAAGSNHSLFLKSDGSLWAMGFNAFGQLGDGTLDNANSPEEIVSSNVIAIAAGGGHSLFLKSDGSLWAMGENESGQLGDGTFDNVNTPEEIVASNVIAIAAGGYHSLFLESDGSLWVMGDNEYGQLGDGTFNNADQPEQIVSNGVRAIAGGTQSLFLKSDGSLWAMGLNDYGQLGDGTFNTTNQPEQIISKGVVAIAAGGLHSLFLRADGTLWGVGYDDAGQLGDGFLGNSLLPEQLVPAPQPLLSSGILFGTNLQFSATCQFGGPFRLLAGTNLTQPLHQWTPVWTKSVTTRGTSNFTATLTNAVIPTASQQFYILQSQ